MQVSVLNESAMDPRLFKLVLITCLRKKLKQRWKWFWVRSLRTQFLLQFFFSGATYSFISKRFVGVHGLRKVEHSSPMKVNTPGNSSTLVSFCPSTMIEIQVSPFLANLILVECKDLDVILGMDWLTKHNGVIDCASRTVTLVNGKGEVVVMQSPLTQKKGVSLNQVESEHQE